MLERCPYYERCDADTRQSRGNGEYYCLGSLNWEFCSQFQHYSLTGESIKGYSRDDEVKQIAMTIHRNLKSKLQAPLILSLITRQGEILYRDRQWSEKNLLVAQNLVRYMVDTIDFGEFFKLQNGDHFLFLKVHEDIVLICGTKIELGEIIKIVKENLMEHQTDLENYLKDHPIALEMESPPSFEENLILGLFKDLQRKLEVINPKMIIDDLMKIKEKISDLFSWNRIFYEISILIERLEGYPVQTELNRQEKEEILKKIEDWREKVRQVS